MHCHWNCYAKLFPTDLCDVPPVVYPLRRLEGCTSVLGISCTQEGGRWCTVCSSCSPGKWGRGGQPREWRSLCREPSAHFACVYSNSTTAIQIYWGNTPTFSFCKLRVTHYRTFVASPQVASRPHGRLAPVVPRSCEYSESALVYL